MVRRLRIKLLCLIMIAIAGIVTTTFNKNGSNKVIANSDTGYGEYSGEAYIVINNNEPSFTQVSTEPYLDVSLDSYGRATEAKALITIDTLSFDERWSIKMLKPSGWHTVRYDGLIGDENEPSYLYNRCHLIMYAMYGEETDVIENLITGTRYLNVEGMLPNEIEVVEYVKTTGKSVEYHVEPIYIDDDLVCRGVHIQALSEDGLFKKNVYCFNVQPHIAIDYKTGNSWINEE